MNASDLFWCIKECDASGVLWFLNDPERPRFEHSRALLLAVEAENADILRMLLESGISTDCRSNSTYGGFATAIMHNWTEGIKIFIEFGANVNLCVTSTLVRVWHAAMQDGTKSTISLLIEAGADIHTHHLIYSHGIYFAIVARNYAVVLELLRADFDPNSLLDAAEFEHFVAHEALNDTFAVKCCILLCAAGLMSTNREVAYTISSCKVEDLAAAQWQLAPTHSQWRRFVELAIVLTHYVASVYEVLWILEFVAAYEAVDECKWAQVNGKLRDGVFASQLTVARNMLPEFRRVEAIQCVMDIANVRRKKRKKTAI